MSQEQKVEQGKRLKMTRKSLGINQEELARNLGVTQSFLSLIESGKGALSRNLLTNMSNHYKQVNAHWLLTGVGEMFMNSASKTTFEFKEEEVGSKDAATLSRRVQYLEQFITNKFPDFNPNQF